MASCPPLRPIDAIASRYLPAPLESLRPAASGLFRWERGERPEHDRDPEEAMILDPVLERTMEAVHRKASSTR